MRMISTGWRITFSILVAMLLTSCARAPTAPLRVGLNPWPGYEFLYLAEVKHFYEQEGVAIKLVQFNSLADALHAYERGQVDVLGCTIIELLMARAESARQAIAFFVPDYSNGADMLLANQEIGALAELKGKRIGVELGSLGVFMLARALDQAKLTMADVTVVSSDQLSMENDMQHGKLDAIVTYPPVGLRLEATGKYRRLFSSAQIPGEVVDVLIADERILAERLTEIRKLVAAFRRAQEYARAHQDEAYAIMAEREGISAADFKMALSEGISLPAFEQQAALLASNGTVVAALRRAEQALLEAKQISRPATPEQAVSTAAL